MIYEEFKEYMDRQITEIIRYSGDKTSQENVADRNKCVFDWIRKNAKNYEKKWFKS